MATSSTAIRRTLMRMIFISSGAVLAVTTTAFCAYELLTFRQSSVQQLQILSQAIASNSTAALAFDKADDASDVLAAFKADPHIVAAALYDAQGKAFATYPHGLAAASFPVRPGTPGYTFGRTELIGFQPVAEGSRRLGTLFVKSDLGAMYARAALYALIVLLVIVISLPLAYLISRRLQHQLLHPILAPAQSLTVDVMGVAGRQFADKLGFAERMNVPLDANGLSRCVAGQVVYEPDVLQVPFPFPQRLAAAGLRSVVTTPLIVENQVFGILVCARRDPESFSSGECEFLKQLSEHVALATHQSRLYVALQQAYDDLRLSQHTVMQQERLRALGQMASGIAHDINNAISPVSLYTESLLEREPNLSERTRNYLTTIQRAIEDVARTVARMREFYRERDAQLTLERVDINRAVLQVVELTRPRWSDLPQQRGVMVDLRTEW